MTQQAQWQPIETAPKDGRRILAASSDPSQQNMTVIYWEPGSVKFNIIGHWRSSVHTVVTFAEVTHWMPLPPAPEAKP